MTTQKEMSVVLLRAGTVSARPLRPKGVPWNGFLVFGVVGLVWACVLVRVPRLLCLGLVRAGHSLTQVIAGGAVGFFKIFPRKRLSGNTRRHDWSACFGFLVLGLVFVVVRFGLLTLCCRSALLGRSAWAWFGRAVAAPAVRWALQADEDDEDDS